LSVLKAEYNRLKKLQRNLARRDLLNFTTYHNSKYTVNWHHKSIASELTRFILSPKAEKIILEVPPQHGKSELVSRNMPAFALGVNPDVKIIEASYSIDLPQSFSRDIQRTMSSEEYNAVFPESALNQITKDYASKTAGYFEVPNHKGSFRAVGVTGGIAGFPGDIAIIDDPIKDPLEAYSKTYRDRVWEWYLSVWLGRLHNNSKQIIITTRWHEDDLVGRILEFEGSQWKRITYPAIKDEANINDPRQIGEALWPEKHSLEKLLKIKTMSERVFNALYQQRPSAVEGNILKREWFGRFNMSDIEGCPVYFKSDTAYTEKTQNDYCVIIAYAEKNGIKHIIDMYRKRVEFPDFIRDLKNFYALHGGHGSLFFVEPKASGKSVVQQIRATTNIPIMEDRTPTTDKVSRVMAISPFVESGRCKLLNNALWIDTFLTECTEFPNSKNDEIPDVLAMIMEELLQSFYKIKGTRI